MKRQEIIEGLRELGKHTYKNAEATEVIQINGRKVTKSHILNNAADMIEQQNSSIIQLASRMNNTVEEVRNGSYSTIVPPSVIPESTLNAIEHWAGEVEGLLNE